MAKVTKQSPSKKSIKKKPGSTKPFNWFYLIVILVVGIVVYFPVFSKEFINYDDDWYIYENPFLNPFLLKNIGKIFSEFYSGQYSPIPMTFLGILHNIVGNSPALYNVSGVLLHLINIGLVCWFVFRIIPDQFVALATSALFAFSPLQVESIAWSSAVFKTGFYAMFFLLSLISYTYYISSSEKKYFIASLVFFLLSFLSKEQAVAISLSIIAIDYFKSRNLLSKQVLLEKLPFLVLSVVFGLITLMATKSNREALTYSTFTFPDRILYACYALGEYFVKLVIPYDLASLYPYPNPKNFSAWFYLHPVIIAGVCYLFYRSFKKNKIIAFGLLFFLANIAFTLVLQIVSVREVVMADRYVYVSSIGFFLIATSSLKKIMDKNPGYKGIYNIILVAYLIFMANISYQRTKVWENTLVFGIDGAAKHPNPLVLMNLGIEYKRLGKIDLALTKYNEALALNPSYGLAYMNRGNIYFDRNQDSLALKDYAEAISFKVNIPKVYTNRAGIYARNGKFDLAFADFEKALQLDSNYGNAYKNRALAYYSVKNYDAAIKDYSTYLKLVSTDDDSYSARGEIYQLLNQHQLAIQDFDAAIKIAPRLGYYYMLRAYSEFELGNKNQASQDVSTAQQFGQQVDPAFIEKLK